MFVSNSLRVALQAKGVLHMFRLARHSCRSHLVRQSVVFTDSDESSYAVSQHVYGVLVISKFVLYLSLSNCQTLGRFLVIITLRTCAIWGRQRWVLAVLGTLTLVRYSVPSVIHLK